MLLILQLRLKIMIIIAVLGLSHFLEAQQVSIAREWNEEVLGAITRDLARPTVHARNLFHTSIAMYDVWAVYQPDATPFFLGKNIGGFEFEFDPDFSPPFFQSSIDQSISFAVYRLLLHRFEGSPGQDRTFQAITLKMQSKGYDTTNESTDYLTGGPAELGNYIAEKMIEFGNQDGSNEAMDYANLFYEPVNPPLTMDESGNPDLIDINRWQPLNISDAVDQAGNPVEDILPFLSPEWGNVYPFSLTEEDVSIYHRDGNDYRVFMDPGPPIFLDENNSACESDLFKTGFLMVSIWQSHLDPADTTLWDISPASFGNMGPLPDDWSNYEDYYNFFDGGDISSGHAVNPVSGEPYEPQIVKRADYARILAEFWADGPDSETPPGHWFSIYNHVRDHSLFENRWMGEGYILSDLEYDLRAYLLLGGAMHDAAIAAWSVKGFYDYIRPVSAIRYLGQMGQCSDPDDLSYNPLGFPLIPGYVELIRPGDDLEGENQENIGKIKLFTWRGPDYIDNPLTDVAGVGWILAEDWWPYQRPSFVTPPFAGFVSGHSTYSRAAAEVMTLMTGTPFFPGGMGEFYAPANDFLEFENGPSEDIYLQWATYRDASDQTSLSRIWGGIHPAVDDIPGRIIGYTLGRQAVNFMNEFLELPPPLVESISVSTTSVNLSNVSDTFQITIHFDRRMDVEKKPELLLQANGIEFDFINSDDGSWVTDSSFQADLVADSIDFVISNPSLIIRNTKSWTMIQLQDSIHLIELLIDLKRPELTDLTTNYQLLNIINTENENLSLNLLFNKACQTTENPQISFPNIFGADSILIFIDSLSAWSNDSTFIAVYEVASGFEFRDSIDIQIAGVLDLAGNSMDTFSAENFFYLDTNAPELVNLETQRPILNISNIDSMVSVVLAFSEKCMTAEEPIISFLSNDDTEVDFSRIDSLSGWENDSIYSAQFSVIAEVTNLQFIGIEVSGIEDLSQNEMGLFTMEDFMILDLIRPELMDFELSHSLINVKTADEEFFEISLFFNEACDTTEQPLMVFSGLETNDFLTLSDILSTWQSDSTYLAVFEISDEEIEISDISISIDNTRDIAGNELIALEIPNLFSIDTRPPGLVSVTANAYTIETEDIGEGGLIVTTIFDEPMNTSFDVFVEWVYSNVTVEKPLVLNTELSGWEDDTTWVAVYDVQGIDFMDNDVGLIISSAEDLAENKMISWEESSFIAIDIQPVSTDDFERVSTISLFPNPIRAGENLILRSDLNLKQAVSYEIFDNKGSLVLSGKEEWLSGKTIEISTANLTVGMYLMYINAGGAVLIKNFVIHQ
ncbi:MAG: T9SS C-terminal target domain-containing protein [Saprospirales bacterium]|nr:MAG: T9SS C-terminal target domain-containing protein [Saprospirales bacterium]